MNLHLKIFILGVFLAIAGWAVYPQNACASAGTIANQTCDTQVWQTMSARAQIETEREIMQNQNLIFKPDSILDYTCFDSFAGHAASTIGVLFTHTKYWGIEVIPEASSYGMATAMQNVVLASLTPYKTGNFPHAYLGGRGTQLALPQRASATSSSGPYSCGEMAKVWKVAKCMNFLHTSEFGKYDGYYPFLNLAAGSGGTNVEGYERKNEVRQYPEPCSGTPIPGSNWKEKYHLSRNETNFGSVDKLYQFGTPLKSAYQDVRQKVEPGTCGTAVKTGIKVILGPGSSGSSYEDGVCTNPGCTYTKGGTCN